MTKSHDKNAKVIFIFADQENIKRINKLRWILLFCVNFIMVHFFVMIFLTDIQNAKGISNLVHIKYKSTKDDVVDLIGHPHEIDYQKDMWIYNYPQGYIYKIKWLKNKVVAARLWPEKFEENKMGRPVIRITSTN